MFQLSKLSPIIRDIDIIGQLADLKEVDYKNVLALSALVELLIEKGIITQEEIEKKAQQLDAEPVIKNIQ